MKKLKESRIYQTFLDLDIDFEITSLSHHDEIYRPRYALESYGKYWKEWKDYIHTFEGDNPYVTYCQQLGISNDLLNAFRRKMIDGTPSEITGGGSTEEPDVPTGNNAILTSINTDGSIYNNGQGYKNGYRFDSSYSEVEYNSTGAFVTGYIPYVGGKKITFENIVPIIDTSSSTASYHRILFYDSNFNHLNLKSFEVTEDAYATNNFKYQYKLGDYIILRCSGPINDMGFKTCQLEMKGEGCRDFERLCPNTTWYEYFIFLENKHKIICLFGKSRVYLHQKN